MYEKIFLSVLASVWIIFAVVQDFKKREIADWLNFSLIIFAIGFRFFYSLFESGEFSFFYQGVIGLAIFFVLSNIFYYSRMFAGGDAKLLFALGAVLPFSGSFFDNLFGLASFFILLVFSASIYGLLAGGFLVFRNFEPFKKEFSNQFRVNKKFFIFSTFFALAFVVAGFFNSFLIYFGILIFVLPYFYIGAKSIDESCMIKRVHPKNLTEGDWLYENVHVGKRIIKKSWHGLTKKDIALIKKNKKFVLVREGIPFSPAFLISFLVFLYLQFFGYPSFFIF